MTRLLIFTTHPIQYQAPWFRALAQESDLDIEVVFSYLPTAQEQGIGFGHAITWDIPLLDGYRHRVLSTKLLPSFVPDFARRWASGIARILDETKPDAAMVLGWQDMSLVQALLTCRRHGVPVVMRGESNALRSRSVAFSLLHRRYFRLCDAFLAIGHSNAALYSTAGVPASRIVTASYFVDNARFKADADRLREQRDTIRDQFGIAAEAVCFAFVGKLEHKKRPLDMIEALRLANSRGSNVSGLVVGTGELMDLAQAYAQRCAAPVAFAGFLNQNEIASAYVAADALILPSDFGETWGLVVNEAMATGLPAIVSERIGAAHDLVVDGVTGYVVPFKCPDAIAVAMTRLAADVSTRQSMGRLAQERVHRDYSIDRAVEATREVLERVKEFNA